MAIFTTYDTWVICVNYFFVHLGWPIVFFVWLLSCLVSRILVPIWLVLLRGEVLTILVSSSSIALVLGMVIFVPLWLTTIIEIKLNHIYASLVGWLGSHSCLWCRRLVVWED